MIGAVAIYGYDGFLYAIGFLVAWLLALLLVAELMRNTGKFTMADVLSFRLRQRPVRIAAAISTLAVCVFYLLPQMAGAGGLVALLIGVDSWAGQAMVIAVVGALMIVYVFIGGMKGTTFVQIIKATLLILGSGIMTVWVMALFGFNFSGLLGDAAQRHPAGEDILGPGLQYGADAFTRLDFVSLGFALVLGTAALPHVLIRFYTVPTAKEARKSVVVAIILIGAFYLFTLVLGYGAAALLDHEDILAAPGGQNAAAPLLAYELGGTILLGVISAVAFATILAVVAGLTITPRHPSPTTSTGRSSRRASWMRRGRCGPARRPWSSSGSWRSWAASAPRDRTSPSWWRWPSPSQPPRTCPPSCTRCSGGASPPAERCGRCTAACPPPCC